MYIEQTLQTYLDDLASSKPAPGGGSAAAVSGAMSAALAAMVCRLTQGKEKYAAVQDEINSLLEQAESLRQRFQQLMGEDIEAYSRLSACFKMPREDDEQRRMRADAIQLCLQQAALVPLEMSEKAVQVAMVCERVAEIGNANVLSDIGAAAMLAASAGTSAAWMVRINLKNLKDEAVLERLSRRLSGALDEITSRCQRVTALVGERA
ncbi:MAG TPA: cyclodeaminase/cyclohydrolase family protein [Ktedonobacteraceae bacterium]|nr:cyclodeaminase/cyclohydrolase family protein [Ktedonobacteraceae bacterium]